MFTCGYTNTDQFNKQINKKNPDFLDYKYIILDLKLSTNLALPWILYPQKSNYVLKHITIKWPLQFLRARIFWADVQAFH